MKRKNKGFTLVELLAVIIIIALISLIATPQIIKLIDRSRKGAFTRSAEGLLKASDMYYMNSQLDMPAKILTFNCSLDTNTCVSDQLDQQNNPIILPISGSVGNGTVTIDKEGDVSFQITNNRYCAYKKASFDDIYVEESNCEGINIVHDKVAPKITPNGNIIKTTNSITIGYTVEDDSDGSGIDETSIECKYGTSPGNYSNNGIAGLSRCTMSNLVKGTYYYKVCVSDKMGNESSPCLTGSAETSPMPEPTITMQGYTTTGTTPGIVNNSLTYVYKDVATVAFTKGNATNPSHYIKTTGSPTVSAGTVASECGNGSVPSETCNDAISITTLEAGYWYKISGEEPTITVEYTSQGDMVAYTYDASGNYGYDNEATRHIDRQGPTLTFVSKSSTTDTIIVNFTATDSMVGLNPDGFTCTIGNKTGNVTNISGDSYKCVVTGIKTTASQDYSIKGKDQLGNESNELTGQESTLVMPEPTITMQGYTTTGTTPGVVNNSLTYVYKDVATVAFTKGNATNPSHYIKTTGSPTVSAGTVASECGNGSVPSETCNDASSITTLEAGYWYKINGSNPTITVEYTSQGDMIAYTYDASGNYGYDNEATRHIDRQGPTLTFVSKSSTTDTITVNFTATDTGSGVIASGITCTIGDKTGNVTNISGDSYKCVATGIKTTASQDYSIKGKDQLGNESNELTGQEATLLMPEPTITMQGYTTTGTTPGVVNNSLTYVYKDVATVAFTKGNATNPNHYIKTTGSPTVSAGTVASECGNGSVPSETCNDASSITTLEAGYWYKINGEEPTITAEYTSQGDMIAYTYDASGNYGYDNEATRHIDRQGPNLTFVSKSSTTDTITVNFTATDTGSGVIASGITCTIGDKTGTVTSISSGSYKCVATGFNTTTSQNYSIKGKDQLGNESNELTGQEATLLMPEPDINFVGYNASNTEVDDAALFVAKDVATVTFIKGNTTNPSHYVRTGIQTTLTSGTITQRCNNDISTNEPSLATCTSASGTILEAGYWYKIDGESPEITIEFRGEGDIYAYTYDPSGNEGHMAGRSRKTYPTPSQIEYDNSNSGSICEDVGCAIDDLYNKLS